MSLSNCACTINHLLPAANHSLLADKVQSIDRAAHTAPPLYRQPPAPHSAAHPSTAQDRAAAVTGIIVACTHPSPAARPYPPCGVLEALCLPRQPSPPSLRRSWCPPFGSTSTSTSRLPPTRKAKVVAGLHQTVAASSTLRRQEEEPWERERERTSSTHRRTLFHLASLSPTPLSLHHHHHTTPPPPILSASPSSVASAPSRPRCHLLTSPVPLRSVLCESFPRFGHK